MSTVSYRVFLSIACLLAASLLSPVARAQTPAPAPTSFRDVGAWCTLSFPKDWKQAQTDKVEKLKVNSGVTASFRAGFAKSLKNGEMELPFAVLVSQPMSMKGVNYDNFEERYASDMRIPMFPVMQSGEPEFYLASNMVVSYVTAAGGASGFAGQKSDVKGVIYSFITRNGLVHLACFDKADRFDKTEASVFEEIVDTMAIDRGQEFNPKQSSGYRSGRRGIYGVGGGVGFIVILLLRWWASR